MHLNSFRNIPNTGSEHFHSFLGYMFNVRTCQKYITRVKHYMFVKIVLLYLIHVSSHFI